MPVKVTAAEADTVILRLLHIVRVPAAAGVRAAVQAEAVRGVHPVRAGARVSVRGVGRVIVRAQVGAATSIAIHRARATAAVRATNIRRVRAAEATRPYLNRAKAVQVLRASRMIRRLLGREKKRRANRISQNTRNRKIRGRCSGMIHIEAERRR